MAFWNKLFGKKEEEQKVGGMEDFMTLIRVYFQAVMAADLGITNLAALPDLRTFKATLKVPTQNNKLGLAEKTRCKKMLKELYQMDDNFTKEIESSIKSAIRTMTEKTVNDIFTKNDFTDAAVMKTVVAIRQYDQKLGFSQQWVTDFVFRVVMLAKKEKQAPEN